MTDLSKISLSLGPPDSGMTSTPNVPNPEGEESVMAETDEQKTRKGSNSAETDEQKTESAYRNPTAPSGNVSCVWRGMPTAVRDHNTSCSHTKDAKSTNTLSDFILGHRPIMFHFIQALSCCNSSTMAMILGSGGLSSNLQDSFAGLDPVSVGDGIFQILCTLNRKASNLYLILKPLLEYVSSSMPGLQGYHRMTGISRLSEPLLWFILRVLDCEKAITIFMEMGNEKE